MSPSPNNTNTNDVSNTVVLDTGSHSIKVGFAGADKPAAIVPSVVAQHRSALHSNDNNNNNNNNSDGIYVGRDAIQKAERAWDVVRMRYPMSAGLPMDWDHLEDLWDLSLETLTSSSSSSLGNNNEGVYPDLDVVLPVHPLLPQHHRTTIAEIMLETFNVRRLSLISSGVASVWSSGNGTGLSVESGDGCTVITPVMDHLPAPCPPRRCPVSGSALSSFLRSLLPQDTAAALADYRGSKVIRHIKHNMCYVSLDLDQDLRAARNNPEEYRQSLKIGNKGDTELSIGAEAFLVPEMIFEPSVAGIVDEGLPSSVIRTVTALDTSLRAPLLRNIVLGGGNTLFDGLVERLGTQVRQDYGSGRSTVNVDEGRLYRVFEGASIFGVQDMQSGGKRFVSREKWQEEGTDGSRWLL